MSFSVKRKRGRPRRDEPREINDFDLALIQEFQKRPCFYDRTHVQYRNREYLEPQWADIANTLGYNVSLIKDRMLQLRNRYNLEKRRVENLQSQYNDPEITSQWALYKSLAFLGEHIKTRRPIQQQCLPVKQPVCSNSSETDADEDVGDSQLLSNGKLSALAHLNLQLQQQAQPTPPSQPLLLRPHISHSYSNTSTTGSSCMNNHRRKRSAPVSGNAFPQDNAEQRSAMELLNSRGAVASTEKFKAFGQFLASSLIEMNESEALRLVEKFTMELVGVLMAEQDTHHANEAACTNNGSNVKRFLA